ncbi:hypothetical protein [Halocatena pleomorpha]|uniref:hypothetical protein n=1 Tax=Halocatena pleomorpha TaxID=1785090 RepID=UPI00163A28F0|nr:hypothetical protein [Halocatena pleomorpha]
MLVVLVGIGYLLYRGLVGGVESSIAADPANSSSQSTTNGSRSLQTEIAALERIALIFALIAPHIRGIAAESR